MEVEHAQGVGTTPLYLTNMGVVGHWSEIREGMVWWWGEGGSLFWEKCFTRMTYHPKEGKMN